MPDMLEQPQVLVLIMAGGAGTRLWPASTPQRPKHLLPLIHGAPRSLLEQTFDRALGLTTADNIFVVTAATQRDQIARVLPMLADEQIIQEPEGRNTAACIALSLLYLQEFFKQKGLNKLDIERMVLTILPADHRIGRPGAFLQALQAASRHAFRARTIVTLGILPDHPATGYGYIERGADPVKAGDAIFPGLRFVEKPDARRAREFLDSGQYVWNAGLFVASFSCLTLAFSRHAPKTWQPLSGVADTLFLGPETALAQVYSQLPAVPFDIAVMEKLDQFCVLPVDVDWSDLGAWDSVYEHTPKDPQQNAVLAPASARVRVRETDGCLVFSDGPEVAVLGVRDTAVIVAGTRVLVCSLARAQAVRDLAKQTVE